MGLIEWPTAWMVATLRFKIHYASESVMRMFLSIVVVSYY